MPAHPLQALWAALALDIPLVATAGKALPTSRNWEEFASDGTATPRRGAAVMISREELSRHGSPADCWAAVGDTVYDLTSVEKDWPGGEAFLEACGADATPRWEAVRGTMKTGSGVHEWLAARIKGQYFASAGRVSADSEPQLPSRALFSKQDAGGPKKSKKGKKSLVELPKSTSGSGGKDALGEMRGRGPIGETNGSSLVELHHGDPDDDGEDGDGKYGGDDDDEALAQTAERKARSGSSRNRHDDAGEGDDDDDEDDEDDDDDDEALAQTSGRETRKSNRHRRAAADEGPYDAKDVELARASRGQADARAPLMRRAPIA